MVAAIGRPDESIPLPSRVANRDNVNDSDGDDTDTWWDEAYAAGDVPWEVDGPQPAVREAYATGWIDGDVLDVGCGLGTEARFIADNGHEVRGIDTSSHAIAGAKERTNSSSVSFEIGDVFDLTPEKHGRWDTVLDCGLFHVFEDTRFDAYAEAVGSVTKRGGTLVLVAFGPEAPTDWPPNPISPSDIRETFAHAWSIERIDQPKFETRIRPVDGIRAVMCRTNESVTAES